MSQDKFWEQWNAGAKQPEGEAAGKPAEAGGGAGNIDSDALAAWLKTDPLNDPIVPPPSLTPHSAPANAADLAALWPPQAPVDPFTGIQSSSGGGAMPADWDLAFEDEPAGQATAGGAVPGVLDDFALETRSVAPAAGNPFAPDAPVAAPAPPPVQSPFGPPPPPVSPPEEALKAQPLRLVITVGRRTTELVVQGEALIGRPDATRGLHPEIDLRADDAVSRRHAKIFVRGGHYVLTDLNSTNGTRHNHAWVQPELEIPLKAGDEIEVGEMSLIKVIEAPDPHA